MKYIKILFIALMFLSATSNLKAQNWTNWVSLQNRLDIDVSVSFSFNNLSCNMGNGHYRINNNTYSANGYIVVAFKYVDCNGSMQDQMQTKSLSRTGLDEDGGYWFTTSSDNIRDIRMQEAFIPEKKMWIKLINGVVVDVWKQRYGNGK
jgi:hypothetical protein